MINDLIAKDKQYHMNTFGNRLPVAFARGEGMKLFTAEGDEYYDFLGGIAVNALGHSHPALVTALKNQVERLLHTSNLYYIENQTKLAEKICLSSCADKVFFSNSGAEANEGAFKLAKIYFHKKGEDRYEIITLDKSFHGRTLATVAATGQEKYQKPYRPLTPGFVQIPPNDFEALSAAVTDKTAAIMLELIQGEAGVYPMDTEYVRKVRELCDEKGILLMFDEVQTGMGRTGELFAHMKYDVKPDIFTLAKALGGGVPIGAICARDFVASAFEPGDHGSTFGGNPLATVAGLTVFEVFERDNILENVRTMSEYFMSRLGILASKHSDKIVELRSSGLLIGIELKPEIASDVFKKLFDKKYLTSLCHETLRLAPPLIIAREDIDGFCDALDSILS